MENQKQILVLGSLAFDYIMDFEGDLNANLTSDPQKQVFNLAVMPHSKHLSYGGTCGNISYNLAQLNGNVRIITAVGKDFNDLGYKKRFEDLSCVDLDIDLFPDLFTASCYIVNDKNHNQLIIFHEGAMKKCPEIILSDKGITKEFIKIATVSPDNFMAMIKWARELELLGIPFIFDPGQVTPAFSADHLREIIPKANILIGNQFEINMILEKLGVDFTGLLRLNPTLIITKGEMGSECYYMGQKYEIPACKPDIIKDTTGAGDAFRAGLLFGLYFDKKIPSSCKIGATMASFAIETIGPQTQNYSLIDVKKRYEKNFNETLEI